MTTTPSHAAQDTARAKELNNPVPPVSAAETADALNSGMADAGPQDPVNTAGAPVPPATPAPDGETRPAPVVRSRFDDKRSEITARFRSSRAEALAEAQDDVTAFAREGGMPEDFRQAAGEPTEPIATEEPAAVAPQTPAPAPAPTPEQKFKLTVNGRQVEMTADQLVAEAQKALAAGDILGEAKSLRTEIARLRDEALAGRQPVPANQGNEPAQPEQPLAPTDVANQDDLVAVVERIQFGDPKEAAALLRQTIASEAAKVTAPAVEAGLTQGRLREEGARTLKVLQDFKDQNPELAADPIAHAAMERVVLDLQLEDLGKAGLDPGQLRTDGRPPTAADIANAHRWLRSQPGTEALRSPETMLVEAKNKVLAWKGVAPQPQSDPPPPPVPPQNGVPRVEISVNRAERRAAVQPQPQRTAVPQQRQPAQQPAQPRDRSDVVRAMQRRAATQRGRAPLSA